MTRVENFRYKPSFRELICEIAFARKEFLSGFFHSIEHSFFAHDFEHVIKTWADRSAAYGNTRGMNKIAGLSAEFLREILQGRFKRRDIPLVDLGELVAQSDQSLRCFRFAENFRYRLRIELVFLGEEIRSPFRHVFEKFDLFLHDREHVAQIFFVGDVDLRFFEEWATELDKAIKRHLRDVLAVEPKTFVEIERGVAAIDFFELEKFYNFVDVDLFAVVLRGPTEQTKIITHRFGRITLLDVSGDARAFVAFAHL